MNAVVTISVGAKFNKISELTHTSIRAYAERIGAEFIVISESSTEPQFEKFRINSLLNKYSRIIYLDSDLIVKNTCPDLFGIVPEYLLGVFNEGAFCERASVLKTAMDQYNIRLKKWDGKYFNTGVMVISRIHKFLFVPPETCINNFYEQSLLNLRIHSTGTKVFDLDYKFNRMSCMDSYLGRHRLNCEIVHYAGAPDSVNVLELIAKDIEAWENDSFSKKTNILYRTQGGLGDVVCAEPVIRDMLNMYKGDNFVVETFFPRIFSHIPSVVKAGEFVPEIDTPYRVINSMTSPEHLSWQFMSVNLMHTTDFISLLSSRKILPDKDKQIKLKVDFSDIQEIVDIIGVVDLASLVVVHPGKGWASKTFPSEFWEAVIDGLVDKGERVVIIGQRLNEEQGTVDIKINSKAIDLRNLTSLGGVIALISQAKTLITNDSAPLHIAGAFDNKIILIPSCKHPDWCLPYRHGSKSYKSVSLYKKLMSNEYNSMPTNVNGESVDYVVGDYSVYLPDTKEVVEAV